jgi:hypothetical protein
MIVKNLKTCIGVLLYTGYIMAKSERPHVHNSLDTSQIKAVHLAGQIVTSVNTEYCCLGHRANSDPDKISGLEN